MGEEKKCIENEVKKGEKGYKKISREVRLKLIDLVCNEKLTIKDSAKIMGLSASTSRVIVRKYQDEGVVFETKADKSRRKAQ